MFLEKPREPEKAVARKEPSWSLSRWPPSALLSFPSVSLSAIRFHIYCIHWLLENNKIRPFILIFLSIADDNIVWWTMYYIWYDHHIMIIMNSIITMIIVVSSLVLISLVLAGNIIICWLAMKQTLFWIRAEQRFCFCLHSSVVIIFSKS